MLHAVGKLTQKRPELRLVLIARPKPGGDTERVIDALGLAERIQFVGGVTHEEINQLYAESAAAVVPSLYEGFGLPAVEAMSAGIPLISSDGGALAEVVGEGGLLVPAGDSEALAAGLQRVLSDADLARELSNRGLRRARQQFCWSVCAQQMVDEYRACISRC